jgi:RNA polymerase sigma-70 factor (ECF subfamily)
MPESTTPHAAPIPDLHVALPDGGTGLPGDERAFQGLFDTLYAPLRGYARGLTQDEAVAEDLVQEAFVRLWDRRDALPADVSVSGYLYRTVRNLALNQRRDRATRQRLLEDPVVFEGAAPSALPHPDTDMDRDELGERLASYVSALPPRQREALELSRFQGLSHADVAVAMGCSPRTVNNHLVAALSTLRRRLADFGSLVAAFAWWLT